MKEKDMFKRLREKLFGKGERPKGKELPKLRQPMQPISAPKFAPPSSTQGPLDSGHFVQIGLDFGTAFTKCVYRDVMLDKAWVHLPSIVKDSEMPFLLPSVLHHRDGKLSHPGSTGGAYKAGCIYHVKMALEKVGKENWSAPELTAYQEVAKALGINVADFVEACAVYFIAGALGGVLHEINARFKGASAQGQIFVNMAVPVADIDHPNVNEVFCRTLRLAWVLAEQLAEFPKTGVSELMEMIRKARSKTDTAIVREACFLYPEVSANVQAFVRSRVSREGLYLFSDTGAGTVDQSVFLFSRSDGKDRLTYLAARVLPLGSSHIEIRAASKSKKSGWQDLEQWRELKESKSGRSDRTLMTVKLEMKRTLMNVKLEMQTELSEESSMTIGQAKLKLINPQQINQLTMIFGGGGHCHTPYELALMEQFENCYFTPAKIDQRRRSDDPFVIGMPSPLDLELPRGGKRWLDRLTVAYGLSFEQGQLADFKLPRQVPYPSPEEIWRPRRALVSTVSKDDC